MVVLIKLFAVHSTVHTEDPNVSVFQGGIPVDEYHFAVFDIWFHTVTLDPYSKVCIFRNGFVCKYHFKLIPFKRNRETCGRWCGVYLNENSPGYKFWETSCRQTESAYLNMLDAGHTPQEARAVLPNSLKTEVVMTANLREWRHFFKLRCSPAAHPQMREIACALLVEFKRLIPGVFDDIEVES